MKINPFKVIYFKDWIDLDTLNYEDYIEIALKTCLQLIQPSQNKILKI